MFLVITSFHIDHTLLNNCIFSQATNLADSFSPGEYKSLLLFSLVLLPTSYSVQSIDMLTVSISLIHHSNLTDLLHTYLTLEYSSKNFLVTQSNLGNDQYNIF
jgi:hypothetical protein